MNKESNFLLSSMSPKVNTNAKITSSRKISKLALKKSLRRSSVYDHLPCLPQNNVAISVTDSTESGTVDSVSLPECRESGSLGSANLPECGDTRTQSKNIFTTVEAELKTPLSKLNQIKQWVAEVNANKNDLYDCNSDINACNVSMFSEISTICFDDNNKKSGDISKICGAANSTFVDNKICFRLDEMFHVKTKTLIDKVEEIKEDEVQNCGNYEIESAVQPSKIPDPIIIIDDSMNNNECFETPVKTAAQIEEQEKILDELYGHSWRSNKEKILTPSESNNDKKLNRNKIYPKSEMKPATSMTYRNPYLYSEMNRSNNILRTLHIDRIQKSMSSKMNRYKDICDSDSSIDSLNAKIVRTKCKTRLNFDDSCSGDENNDSNEHLICNVGIEDERKNIDDNVKNAKNLEKNESKLDSLECPVMMNRDKNNKISEINLGKNEKNSDKKQFISKKVTILDENKTKRNKKGEKSNTRKKKPIKQSTVLSESNEKLNLLDEKEDVSVDRILKENLQSNTRPDTNFERLEDYFKKIQNTTGPKSGLNHMTKYNEKDVTESFLASLSGRIPLDRCDPSARIYRTTYKTCKTELAKKLFDMYNNTIFNSSIPSDTPLEWNDRMRGTAGFCYCRRITRSTGAVERTVRIALATKILDSADRLRDTLVHEMCHAATWIVNEVSDGHGSFWKAWAERAMRIYPELPRIKRCHDYQINTKYTYKCSDCSYSIGRHSKSLDIERKRCGYCYGKFELFINKVTKSGVQSLTPVTPKKELAGFALYVKENYGSAKKENMKHADVMKTLSKQFNELKTK